MKKLSGVIEAQQLDKETLDAIFSIASEMKKSHDRRLLADRIMAVLFYEPSLRTRFSFEIAMLKLGGRVVSSENARQFSSAAKGESLEDTIRVISGYGVDVIVLRYDKEGGAKRAQNFSSVPIINAGDGPGQHPTQALLDVFTIKTVKKFLGDIRGLKIAIMGDLLYSRVVRSLCYIFAKHYPDNFLYLISPTRVRMRPDIKEYLDKYGVKWEERDDFESILPQIDVFYQTRVQKERFADDRLAYEEVIKESKNLIINQEALERMKPEAIIMHPLPRNAEMSYVADEDRRAKYFEQAQNGLYVRMALLKMILVGY